MPKLVLLWISASFLVGIITAGVAPLSFNWSLGFLLPLVFFIFYGLGKKREYLKRWLFFALLLFSFFGGALRYQRFSEYPTLPGDASTTAEAVVLRGSVVEPSEASIQYSEVVLEIQQVADPSEGWQPAEGKVLIRLPEEFFFSYRTALTLQGTLIPAVALGEKAHTSWLEQNGIHYQMFYPTVLEETPFEGFSLTGVLHAFHGKAHRLLQAIMPYPESELLAGILLGIESRIPEHLREAYRLTGTAHILAISGFNIVLIAGMVSRFFNRLLPYRIAAMFSIVVIALYAIFVGAQPAVLRAALMGIISIPAYLIGRRVIGIHSLSITAALMALFNPYLLWNVSFQFSVCATLGIMMYADFFTRKADGWLQKSSVPSKEFVLGFVKDSVIITFSAQVATLPVLTSQFGEISLISPLVNLLILPLQPSVVILGGLALVGGWVFYPMGRLIGMAAWLLSAFTDQIILFFSQIPLTVPINPVWGGWLGAGLNGLLIFIVLRDRKRATPQPANIQG